MRSIVDRARSRVREIRAITTEMATLRSEIDELRADVNELRGDNLRIAQLHDAVVDHLADRRAHTPDTRDPETAGESS